MEDDVKQSSTDRYAVSQAYRWRAERDVACQELEKIKSKQPSMTGNKERHEVAQRLRKAIGLTEFAEVLGFNWTDDSDWVWKDVSNLVADLIESSEPKVKCVAEIKIDGGQLEQLVHDAAVELTGIDRDALLALADELEEDACWEVQTPGDTSGAWRLKDACDRIREALGVEP